jgi:UDP:flavonoid glycosyltransferase YjiC (YdhE family)
MAAIGCVTWDGSGNVPPMLGVASELARRGHAVRVLGQPQQAEAVAARGLPFEPFVEASWRATEPKGGAVGMFRAIAGLAGGRFADQLPAVGHVDLLVVDPILQSVLRAARSAGIPHAALQHSFLDAGPLARLQGLRPWRSVPLGLVATVPELDPWAGRRIGPHVHYVGPVWQGVPRPATPDRPRVLVSLSTVWFPRLHRSLQTTLDALAGLSAEVVVTVAPSVDRSALRVPAGIEVRGFVPHADLLPTVSVLVGHGGHATTMAALAHDVPLVVLPTERLMDQPTIARAVARAGAGVALGTRASAAEIRAAVEAMLADGPHRAAAARLGAAIRERDGAATAADLIEQSLSGL